MYIVKATVNYPEARDIETPEYRPASIAQLSGLVLRLLSEEHEAISFVISVVKVPNGWAVVDGGFQP